MNNYFECKVRYDKMMENGIVKAVTEPYLVEAMSFTEAEARIIEEMAPFIQGEFMVSAIKRANYSEIFRQDNTDKYFAVKVVFVCLDEKTGKEKKSAVNMLVQASDIDDAKKRLDEGMKETMADYEIESIKETKIVDIFDKELDAE